VTRYASVTSLAPEEGEESRPGMSFRRLEVDETEPLRAEIESFLAAAESGEAPSVTGADGRRALSLALRALDSIHEHDSRTGINALASRPAATGEGGPAGASNPDRLDPFTLGEMK
jgi:hypothetical protein